MVSGDSPETMQKLCLSAKFPHQEIRWNYGIFRSDCFKTFAETVKDRLFFTLWRSRNPHYHTIYYASTWGIHNHSEIPSSLYRSPPTFGQEVLWSTKMEIGNSIRRKNDNIWFQISIEYRWIGKPSLFNMERRNDRVEHKNWLFYYWHMAFR